MIDPINIVIPLCDVKGCTDVQCGEYLEVPVETASLWVRVSPCWTHLDLLRRGWPHGV